MKFVARAGDLADALASVSRVVPKNPSLAVYAGVRLTVKAGVLTLTGSDEGETTIIATVPATKTAPGDKVINPKPLAVYLATLPASTQLEVSAGAVPELVVQPSGGSPYRFRLMEVTYPNMASAGADVRETDLTQLAAAARAVKDAAAGNKLVQVVSDERGLRLHATDNVRLARIELPEAGFGTFSGLMTWRVLEQIAEAGATQVTVDRRGRIFSASGPTTTVITRLVDEQFPVVDSVLDDSPRYSVEVSVADLRDAIRRLASVAEARPAVVEVDGDSVTLTIDDSSVGGGTERVELIHPATASVTFGVNLEYLLGALNAHPVADVELGWTTPQTPIRFSSRGAMPVTTITMPTLLR